MNGLINRANKEFKEKVNLSPNHLHPHTLHCTRAYLYADKHVDVRSSEPILCPINAPPDGCYDRTEGWAGPKRDVATDHNGAKLAAELRLVVLARDDTAQHGIGVHGGTFEHLFKLFRIDPYIKYLVARSVDGYYSSLPPSSHDDGDQHGGSDSDGSAPAEPRTASAGRGAAANAHSIRSFYVSVRDSHMLLWSCAPAGGPGRSTALSVIAICGHDEVAAVESEVGILASLIGHPAFPVLACCSRIAHQIDTHVEAALCTVKAVESYTGMSPDGAVQCRDPRHGHVDVATTKKPREEARKEGHGSDESDTTRASIEWLGEMSGWMSEASVQLAQHSHHLGLVRDVVQKIRKPTFEHISNAEVEDVAHTLVETTTMTVDFLQLMVKRVDVQQQVVSRTQTLSCS
jgi:hypothetical protein